MKKALKIRMEEELLKVLEKIETLINQDASPLVKFELKCKKCAYIWVLFYIILILLTLL